MPIAGYLNRVTRLGSKIAVFFCTLNGEFVEMFNDVESAFRWLEEANLNTDEAVYDLDW